MPKGILFPFKNTQDGGVFRMSTTSQETIKSDLIAFLTLKRRQRPMRNNLYSPYYDYLFEPWDEIADSSLKADLVEKLKEFFPEINLDKIDNNFDEDTHTLHSKLIYTIPNLGNITDEVEISVQADN